ncbi:ClpXP protease specificity-enhancing factor [Hydromonas duriensis]|uniref:Stringent starvation protein B n=1 Tax=Hydromonas duriensis TaxID=1527608 RepID=A0A4R6YBQ5_9BURK|nr:ClpXP protease specificity-enhancing factor [Hydromonas duriensis]TDR33039.1 stringent starvation protein B [Hydromonas duriensis]
MLDATQKPYIVRALWDWCNDLGQTPHILVQVTEHARVPMAYVKDGRIVLDVSMEATSDLNLAGDAIDFQARFGGVAHHIHVPYRNIIAIFSAESGQGMSFEFEDVTQDEAAQSPIDTQNESEDEPPSPTTPPTGKGSPLKLVK